MGRFLTVFVLFLAGCQQREEAPERIRPVQVVPVALTEIDDIRSFPGRTRAVNRANLSFRVSGPLIERPVFVGDEVAEGDVLARIDPRDFEVKLDNINGELEKTEAELRFAESDYERAVRIQESDPGAISESLVDRKKEDRNRLQGELRALDAQVDAAEDELSYTILRAPYDGTIVATFVENFEFVNAKQPIIRLLDNTLIEMVIDVPETFIGQIPQVGKIDVSFDILPGQRFPAELKEIGTEATVSTRTYPVTLLIKQEKEGKIIAGMAGDARLYKKGQEEGSKLGVLLPSTALFTEEEIDKSYVWVLDATTDTVEKRPIQKGRLTTRGVVIEEGLTPGEQVVTVGVHSLKEGQKVRLPTHEDRERLKP